MSVAESPDPAGNRIAKRFASLRAEGRGGLVTFVTAGDPDDATSRKILDGLPEAGADLIELGMPFTDPAADGPAIQASGLRALNAGGSLRGTLDIVSDFRSRDRNTPVILMGYFNPIYAYGVDDFARDAAAAGVDGLIVVDLPPEEAHELRPQAMAQGMDFIRLATPTSDDVRLPIVVGDASGFIYYVSILGITGTKSATDAQITDAVERIRRHTDLPVAVGFGIKTPEAAAAVTRVADAVVVGTVLVNKVLEHLDDAGAPKPGVVDAVLGVVRDLAAGVRSARG